MVFILYSVGACKVNLCRVGESSDHWIEVAGVVPEPVEGNSQSRGHALSLVLYRWLVMFVRMPNLQCMDEVYRH